MPTVKFKRVGDDKDEPSDEYIYKCKSCKEQMTYVQIYWHASVKHNATTVEIDYTPKEK